MTPVPLASPVSIGEIVAGKYRVESVLGAGAMGVVVGARHIALDHVVAIKLLLHHRYGTREESIARFLTEARAAAKIASDHVARVHDVGTLPDGTPYMVMEHLDGCDLDAELERRGPLPLADAVDFVLQAADAIAAADQLGIVHRDLKPANLFIATRGDGMRQVKVLDFGISKTTKERQSQRPREDGSFGTPAYMSPEQVIDPASVDTRTDVWALGAILYELLTGRMAFAGPNVKATLDLILTTDAAPMSTHRRDLPSEVEAIVTRCLARDRELRFRDATELAYALAPFGSLGRLSLTPAAGVSSMEAMVVGGAVREAMQTEPDPAELGAVAQGAIRRRMIRDVILVASSVVFLAATVAIVAHQLAPAKERATSTPATSAPPATSDALGAPAPPVASIAPPVPASVQSAINHVQSATVSAAPPPRSSHPRTAPKR